MPKIVTQENNKGVKTQQPRKPRNKSKPSPKFQGKLKLTKGQIKNVKSQDKQKKLDPARQQMTDPRHKEFTMNLSEKNDSSIENPSITYEVPLTAQALSEGMYAVVCFAVSRGWQQSAGLPDYVYWAFVYGTKILIAYATNTTVQSPEVPKWLNIIGNAIMPKTSVQFGSGKAAYIFSLDDPTAEPAPIVDLGPLVFNRQGTLYIPNITGVPGPVNNLFFTMIPPGAYTDDGGKKAWASLCQFLQNVHSHKSDPRTAMHKMVASNLTDKYTYEASAYANTSQTPGGGGANTGGIGTQVSNEVPIRVPLLAAFKVSSSTLGSDPARYPIFTRTSSGDVLCAFGQMVHILSPFQVQRKAYPYFKCVDFLEFGEVVGYWAQALAKKYVTDPQNIAVGSDPVTLAQPICPLTLQEMLLCLRSVFMNLLKDTQFMTQGLYPILPSSMNDNQFVAFVAGTGTGPLPGVTDMLLPLSIVENMRALTGRVNMGGKGGKFNPQFWAPVLGQYLLDYLDEDQFTFTNFDESDVSVFTPAAGSVVKKIEIGKDGKPVRIFAAETPIGLIDGKSGVDFIAINDPGSLNTLIERWNQWVINLSSFSMTLNSVGTDAGINALCTVTTTNHWDDIENPPSVDKKKSLEPKVPRLGRFGNVSDDDLSPYNTRSLLSVTSHDVFFAASWETIQQHWVKPINHSFTGGNLQTFSNFNRIRALFREPHTLTIVENDLTGSTLQNLHLKFAELMVKARNSEPNAHERFLLEMDKTGRGGILSSLVASLAGPILGPDGAAIAKGIAGMLPF